MALTITNTNSLNLLSILNRTSTTQSNTLTRLSTGSRINSGADDPAGLIAMSGLDVELTGVGAALSNNQRTDSMLSVADGALGEIKSMLNDIQSLAVKSANSAGLSASEVAANQAQLDNAIAAIDRLVGSTEFNGKKLLDGSLAMNVKGGSTDIKDVQVYTRSSNNADLSLKVEVDTAASQASVNVTGMSDLNAASAATISIQGKLGTAVIELTSGSTVAEVATAVNAAKAETGVSATASGGNAIDFRSTEYGEDAFVRVETLSGDAAKNLKLDSPQYDEGVDANVLINGQAAMVDGLNVNYSAGGTSLSFNMSESFGTTAGNKTITVEKNGGATFQLGSDSSDRVTLGIAGMQSARLGSANSGYLSDLKAGGKFDLASDPGKAAEIAAAAMRQVATAQGRIGGFQKFQVKTAINALETTKESLTAARSTIADVDYATETAELNRQNVLMQTAMSLLGLANQQSGQILNLL